MKNMIHSTKWEWPTMPSCRKKTDKLTAENVQMKLVMADNQAKNEKYHQVIETAMSMSQVLTEKTDDLTLQTQ